MVFFLLGWTGADSPSSVRELCTRDSLGFSPASIVSSTLCLFHSATKGHMENDERVLRETGEARTTGGLQEIDVKHWV